MSLRRLNPPLNLLRAFSTVVRFGGVSRAAEALHLTQGAVSKQVQELERWIGAPLFERSRKRLALTPAGERYEKGGARPARATGGGHAGAHYQRRRRRRAAPVDAAHLRRQVADSAAARLPAPPSADHAAFRALRAWLRLRAARARLRHSFRRRPLARRPLALPRGAGRGADRAARGAGRGRHQDAAGRGALHAAAPRDGAAVVAAVERGARRARARPAGGPAVRPVPDHDPRGDGGHGRGAGAALPGAGRDRLRIWWTSRCPAAATAATRATGSATPKGVASWPRSIISAAGCWPRSTAARRRSGGPSAAPP
jgi:hypothetical protein